MEALEEQVNAIGQAEPSAPPRMISTVMSLNTIRQLYQGDFLADLDVGEWAVIRREHLRQNYLGALVVLGYRLFEHEDYSHAENAFRHAIALDGYLEAAHRGIMQCLVKRGEAAQAMYHYQALVKQLDSELGVQPSEETVALHDRIKRGNEI